MSSARVHAAPCMRKRSRFESADDMWHAVLSLMKQVSKGKSRPKNKSTKSYASTHPSWNAVTHAPLDAVATITCASLTPRFFLRVERAQAGASRSLARESHRATAGVFRFVNAIKEVRIHLSNRIHNLTWRVLWPFGMSVWMRRRGTSSRMLDRSSRCAICCTHELPWKPKIENLKHPSFEHVVRRKMERMGACAYALDHEIGYFTNPWSMHSRRPLIRMPWRIPLGTYRRSHSKKTNEHPGTTYEFIRAFLYLECPGYRHGESCKSPSG